MGADLYIPSLYQPNAGRWQEEFDKAVERRDSLPGGSDEREKADARVSECFEQMYSQGYFRDPYNGWDVLWKFGLSWWEDVIPMLDHKGRLSIAGAKRLLTMLTEREGLFEKNVAGTDNEQYFRSRYIELLQFLNQAIALKEPIDCSL